MLRRFTFSKLSSVALAGVLSFNNNTNTIVVDNMSSTTAPSSSSSSSSFSSSSSLRVQKRLFFGKGWDNAALDTVYKCLLRRPDVNGVLRTLYASFIDGRDSDALRRMGDIAVANNTQVRVFLSPHLGDPHRLLKCYSLTAYPIFSHDGSQLMVELDGQHYGAFADPDDDYAKVVIPQLEQVKFLAQALLEAMSWETTPAGAASFLESLYRGAQIPDHVFQTPAVIEHIPVSKK